jgi:spermidine synthase
VTQVSQRLGHRGLVAVATACFFFSGTAGLVYEVVWTRLLGLVFGHTVYAITTVLAAYMGGLALGSMLIGRRADGMRRPLRVYGLLEAAVGVYCLATPWLFRAADEAYLWVHGRLQPSTAGAAALHLLFSAALLLPPTTLMGATLPILSRAVVRGGSLAASQVGALYAVNTWGAVLGTALAGFALIPSLGVTITIWLAVALNLGVAGLALVAERLALPAADAPETTATVVVARAEGSDLSRTVVLAVLGGIGVSGAASMGYEIAWTRALSLVLGSSTYAFAAMLTTFLAGLALGAAVVSRWMRHRHPGLAAFGWLEMVIALTTLATLPLLGRLPDAVLLVLRQTGISFGTVLGTQAGLSFAVMILPTLLIGATFPLAVAALDRGLGRIGRDVGAIYGANTVGTIVGSIATGFVLIRAIGIQNTVIAAAAANLIVGMAVLLVAPEAGRRARWVAGGVCAAFVALAAVIPHWDPGLMTTGVGVYAEMFVKGGAEGLRKFAADRELLFYDEGISTTVSVARDPGGTVLTVNGKGDASNDADMQTQVLSGHIGPLLQPGARRVLVVGLASGVTAGALAQHPFEAIDVAELEPSMLKASRFFETENRHVLADPRVRVIEGDGRSILATANQPYDLIVSEPSNPWIAGVASLFTKDFYEAARKRLSPDGVFVQWLQNYSITSTDMQMVVRTFQEVFPHVSIWAASPNDFLLVATPRPVQLDLAAIDRIVSSSPGVREDFDRFGWADGDLVFRYFLGEEDARRYATGAPRNTDDHPRLEFSAPLALYGSSPQRNEELLRSFRVRQLPEIVGGDPGRFTGPAGHLRAALSAWRAGHFGEARYRLELVGFEDRDARLAIERGRVLLLFGELEAARKQLDAASRLAPSDPELRKYRRAVDALAALRFRPALAEKVSAISSPAEVRGVLAEVLLLLARESKDPDLYAVALEFFQADLTLSPGSYVKANALGGVLLEMGRSADSAVALRRAVALNPILATTQFNLGLALERGGKPSEAASAYEEASRLDPRWLKPKEKLASLRASGAMSK